MKDNKPKFQLLNFDFSTNILNKIYAGNYEKAYREIGDFLRKNNFIHKQYSGYLSAEPITYAKAIKIVGMFFKEKPYLAKAIKSFTVSAADIKKYEIRDYILQISKVQNIVNTKARKPGQTPKTPVRGKDKTNTFHR